MSYSYHARRLAEKHCQARSYNHISYPFCWNVKMYGSPSFDEVFRKMAEEHYHGLADALVCIKSKNALEDRWRDECENTVYNEGVWGTIMEDMQSTFVGPNMGDTMRCCSPKTYKRFSYKPKGTGKFGDELWDVKYEFVGRSGGWLALTEFEGVQMEHIDREVWGSDIGVESWYQKLCCQIVETTWMVDRRQDEYLYQAAFHMQQLDRGDAR